MLQLPKVFLVLILENNSLVRIANLGGLKISNWMLQACHAYELQWA